jgi:hypothetical protein
MSSRAGTSRDCDSGDENDGAVGEAVRNAIPDRGDELRSGSGAVRRYVRSKIKKIPLGSGFF